MLHGVTITLYNRTQTGVDDFNRPIYTETAEQVDDVLIGEPSTEDITAELNLSGKRIAYTLGVPKGDTHVWTGAEVEFWGERFRVIGKPTQGIDDLVPTPWNKKVKVECYE